VIATVPLQLLRLFQQCQFRLWRARHGPAAAAGPQPCARLRDAATGTAGPLPGIAEDPTRQAIFFGVVARGQVVCTALRLTGLKNVIFPETYVGLALGPRTSAVLGQVGCTGVFISERLPCSHGASRYRRLAIFLYA
jgi:hypothetical protein